MLNFVANGIAFTGLVGTAYVTKLWFFTKTTIANAVLNKRGARYVNYDFLDNRPYVDDMYIGTATVDILTGELTHLRASSRYSSVRQRTKSLALKIEREADIVRHIQHDIASTTGSPFPFLWTCKPEHALTMQKLGCDYQSQIVPPGADMFYKPFFDKIHDRKLAAWLQNRLQREGGYKRILEMDMDRVTPIRMIVHTSHT